MIASAELSATENPAAVTEMASPTYRVAKFVGAAVGSMCIGVGVGGAIASSTETHLLIAGSDATFQLEPGRAYDTAEIDGLISGKRATTREVGGEPLGVDIHIDLDTSQLFDKHGNLNLKLLPAYLQLFSNLDQIEKDIVASEKIHLKWGLGVGGVSGIALVGLVYGWKLGRKKYDALHGISAETRALVEGFQQRLIRRTAISFATLSLLYNLPSAVAHPTQSPEIVPNPLLAGTSLKGVEVDGPLAPFIGAIDNLVETYVTDTDRYFGELDEVTKTVLATSPVQLPEGPNVKHIGFIADKHCDTGMDRVIITILEHYGVKTLVSAGDDAFSGSFALESGCTSGLAEKARKAGIKYLSVKGNHDSQMTMQDQLKQGIMVLNNKIVKVNGIDFLGNGDQRNSRWGHVIVPSSPKAQRALVTAQGEQLAETACASDATDIVAVTHDPRAAKTALRNGCGNIVLALSGHTHHEAVTSVTLPPNIWGVKHSGIVFTGASAGGAPKSEQDSDTNPLSQITVGPLQHTATPYILSIDQETGTVTKTSFAFSPEQTLTISQQSYQALPR